MFAPPVLLWPCMAPLLASCTCDVDKNYMVNFLLASFPFLSRNLASASWSHSCFSKVLGGWNLQPCETSELTTLPGWFTSSLVVAQSPRGHCLHVAAHLSSSTLVLQCVAFSRASKGPLRCRRWTFESSPISSLSSHHVGYADFPHPLHATIYNHMFSSSSDPTYITSIRKSGVRRCGGVPVVLVLVAAAAVVILGRGMLWSQRLRKYCPFSMQTATRMQDFFCSRDNNP